MQQRIDKFRKEEEKTKETVIEMLKVVEESSLEPKVVEGVLEISLDSGIVIDLLEEDEVKLYRRWMRRTLEKFEGYPDSRMDIYLMDNYLMTQDKMKEIAEDLRKRTEVKAEE